MLTTFRLKQREVKSVQDFIDGETLAEATHLTSGCAIMRVQDSD